MTFGLAGGRLVIASHNPGKVREIAELEQRVFEGLART